MNGNEHEPRGRLREIMALVKSSADDIPDDKDSGYKLRTQYLRRHHRYE